VTVFIYLPLVLELLVLFFASRFTFSKY
jgi:hypothetical protein